MYEATSKTACLRVKHIIYLNHPEDFIWKPSKSKGFFKWGQIPGEENTNMIVKLPGSVDLFTNNSETKASINYLHFADRSLRLILYTAEQQSNAIKDKILQLEEA